MRLTKLLIVIAVATLLAPASALAWGNGPQGGAGFGAHDWILAQGNRLAIAQGTTWLDEATALRATALPDSIKGDQVYHSYGRLGKGSGRAPTRVAQLYAQAVAQFRAGDRTGASQTVGLLSHYYADVCEPLHTDDKPGESKVLGPFERAVDRLLRTPNAYNSWVTYDYYQRVSDPAALTVSAGKSAHASYATLLSRYRHHGFDKNVIAIARKSVGYAANGVADLIMSIQQDAVEVSTSPEVSSHQGIAVSADYYYVIHTTRIVRYDRSWNATGTNEDPLGGLTGFTQPHLGDGCYYGGKLYIVAENWPDVTNQQILVYDATTLQRIGAFPTGQIHEVASVCVAPGSSGGNSLWVASYLDSSRLFEYDLHTGEFLGERLLTPIPAKGIQGIAYHNGQFYLAAGAYSGIGYLYSVSSEGSATLLYTRHAQGDHEGIDFDGDYLLWLIDNSPSGSHVKFLTLPSFLGVSH